MTLKTRVIQLENQLVPKSQTMPEGLSPREQYFFMIYDTSYPRQVSAANILTPEQAYSAMIGGAF
ncbi:MAG: hypothetical protein ACXW0M_07155 [Methylosarcina sp.]